MRGRQGTEPRGAKPSRFSQVRESWRLIGEKQRLWLEQRGWRWDGFDRIFGVLVIATLGFGMAARWALETDWPRATHVLTLMGGAAAALLPLAGRTGFAFADKRFSRFSEWDALRMPSLESWWTAKVLRCLAWSLFVGLVWVTFALLVAPGLLELPVVVTATFLSGAFLFSLARALGKAVDVCSLRAALVYDGVAVTAVTWFFLWANDAHYSASTWKVVLAFPVLTVGAGLLGVMTHPAGSEKSRLEFGGMAALSAGRWVAGYHRFILSLIPVAILAGHILDGGLPPITAQDRANWFPGLILLIAVAWLVQVPLGLAAVWRGPRGLIDLELDLGRTSQASSRLLETTHDPRAAEASLSAALAVPHPGPGAGASAAHSLLARMELADRPFPWRHGRDLICLAGCTGSVLVAGRWLDGVGLAVLIAPLFVAHRGPSSVSARAFLLGAGVVDQRRAVASAYWRRTAVPALAAGAFALPWADPVWGPWAFAALASVVLLRGFFRPLHEAWDDLKGGWGCASLLLVLVVMPSVVLFRLPRQAVVTHPAALTTFIVALALYAADRGRRKDSEAAGMERLRADVAVGSADL